MHRTRFAAACAIAIASTVYAISRKLLVSPRCSPAPVLGVKWFTAVNAQFPDVTAFRDSSTGRSTWWGRVFALEDFLEMAVNLSTVSKWKKELDVLGEWLHYDEATVR